jgi:hypothetical protein
MNRKWHFTGHAFLILAAISGFSAIVMLLWNIVVSRVFGIAYINFWQALGLLVLCRILFGGFSWGRGRGLAESFHKNHLREKWMNMSPEERKEFIHKHRHHEHHGFCRHGFERDFFNREDPEKKD